MTTQQRDQAFDQSAPEGIMIFNMDSQAMQVFYYPENRATGNKAEKKIWTEAEEEIYAGVVPGYPKPGDLYYNTDTNNLYAWNPTQNLWMPINTDSVGGNGGSSTSNGVTDPSATTSETTGGTGVSSNTAIKEVIVGAAAPSDASLATTAPGIIFADTTSGTLYVAADLDGNGIADAWTLVSGGGAGTPGATGATGATGAQGPQGLPGSGVVSGTGVPMAAATPGSIYIDQSTGETYTASGTTWVQQSSGSVTTTIVSADASNTITLGTDGGASLASTTLEDLITATVTVVSTDASNTITLGTDGGAYLATGAIQKLMATDLIQSGFASDVSDAGEDATNAIAITATGILASMNRGEIWVYRNGVKLIYGTDFTIADDLVTVTAVANSWELYEGDVFEVQWIK